MEVTYLHKDKCPECKEIIWTQEDNELYPPRPCYNVQCFCGETLIINNKTVKGGGDEVDLEILKEKIIDSNKHLSRVVTVTNK